MGSRRNSPTCENGEDCNSTPGGIVKRSLAMVLQPFDGAIAKAFGLADATQTQTTGDSAPAYELAHSRPA